MTLDFVAKLAIALAIIAGLMSIVAVIGSRLADRKRRRALDKRPKTPEPKLSLKVDGKDIEFSSDRLRETEKKHLEALVRSLRDRQALEPEKGAA